MTYSGRIVASCVCALGAIVALGANSALAEDGAPFLPEDVIERVQRSYRHHDGAYEAHVAGLRARYTVADGLFVTSADASIENADQSSGWHVRTVQAVRGVRDLLSTSPEVSARQSAGLSIRHAGLEERLTNSASGVEQSWHFTDAPTGQGVLRVAVEISNGLLPRAADDGGWEVPHPGAGGTLRYGRATWVDGDGVRTPIAATIHGDRIVMEVPADLLESSAYPATLDPTISAEFGMDDPAGTAASHDHWLPGVAFDGTNFLVVWWDRRAGSQVWATRVTPSGEVLDATGIEVSNPGSRPASSSTASSTPCRWHSVPRCERSRASRRTSRTALPAPACRCATRPAKGTFWSAGTACNSRSSARRCWEAAWSCRASRCR